MLNEITTALASLKTMGELTALVLKIKVDSAVTEKAQESQAAMISLQSAMLRLQSQYQELLREKDEIEKRLIAIKNWDAEAQNYRLTEITDGVFVYALRVDKGATSPAHWLCTRCYANKQKSILQRGKVTPDGITYHCSCCGSEILDHSSNAVITKV